MKQIDIVFFSPTGTTKKIALSAAKAIDYKISLIDLTRAENRRKKHFLSSDAVIIAIPVYEEKVPSLLQHCFQQLRGQEQPAAIIAVYGNIGYGIALNQLYQITKKSNLNCVAAATFIGEHSFSSKKHSVAVNRPNDIDLKNAYDFGLQIKNKIEKGDLKTIHIPKGKIPWLAHLMPKNGAKLFSKEPIADFSKCLKCNVCVTACPVSAIEKKNLTIDEAKCLRCFACAKKCPKHARKVEFSSPIIGRVFEWKGKNQQENIFFI